MDAESNTTVDPEMVEEVRDLLVAISVVAKRLSKKLENASQPEQTESKAKQ